MKSIFVVTWFYPPINSSEGQVTFKLLNHSRYNYEVFTQKRCESWSFGLTADFPDRENVRSVYAESEDLESWKEEAFQYFCRNRERFALVMTRSMPPEAHEVGLRIKKAFPELPWIASFGDPVKDNPYQHLDCSLYSLHSLLNRVNRERRADLRFVLRPGRVLRALLWELRHREARLKRKELARLQDDTVAAADLLLFNNDSQLRYMLPDPRRRVRALVVPHSFDAALYPGKEKPVKQPGDRQRFVYMGQLNAIRTALPLLRAIRRLKDCAPDLSERAEFLFYGDMPDSDLAYIVRHGLCDFVRFEPPISYRESLRAAVLADWLIHIDGNIRSVSEENVFFAGKVADYFGAGTPILAITMPRGALTDTLRRAGELVLSFSVNEIKEYLYLILYEGFRVHPAEDVIAGFEAEAVAAEFDEKGVKPLYER